MLVLLMDLRTLKIFFERHVNSGAKGLSAYLEWMRMRLIEIHRMLKPTGSFYCHIDYHAVHYVKVILDEIFGYKNFQNEIVWAYNRFSRRGNGFPSMNDVILFYSKTSNFYFNKIKTNPKNSKRYENGYHTVVDGGTRKLLVYDENKAINKIKEYKKKKYKIVYTKAKEPCLGNVWTDISIINPMSKERTGWPTQKPIALLERIISASSNKGDLVFDCFAGCGTAMNAAHNLKRKWIGIDISPTAVNVNKKRLEEAKAKVNVIYQEDANKCKFKKAA